VKGFLRSWGCVPTVARLREGGSITRKFAELLGGTIGMEGVGTTATAVLPL